MKYINLLLIKKIFLLLFFLSYSPGINGKNILASYEIMWGPLVLGNIKWEYRITTTEYKFIIELKNSKIASKLYPFYGKHVSEGVVKNGNFVSKKYTTILLGFNRGSRSKYVVFETYNMILNSKKYLSNDYDKTNL